MAVAEAGGEGERILAKEEKILDLTSFQLHDLTDVDLPSFLEELDLTANRLSSIDPRISNLSHLQVMRYESFICKYYIPISLCLLVYKSSEYYDFTHDLALCSKTKR